jgi:PRTRC genetic system ThiF family protein
MMKMPKYFFGGAHAITITVIGCGGTGSVLLQHLARINKSLIALGGKGIVVTCVDPKLVTEANLGRQLFSRADIGLSKAKVMVERINRFYGTNWYGIGQKFNNELLYRECFPGNIVISCVDTVASRKDIYNYVANCAMAKYHEHVANLFWIDTGNRKDYGQVVLSSEKPKTDNVFDLFPDMEADELKDDTPSCSLAEALDKQDLFINSEVALVTAQLVWDMLQKQEINWRGAFINLTKATPVRRMKA